MFYSFDNVCYMAFLISIVIPLYNKSAHIESTINSVLDQDSKNFELLIIDDGSTDNSLNIVQEIKSDKIRIIRKKNEGVSKTRNVGIDKAKGDYILFLDADDILLRNALTTFNTLIEVYPGKDVYVGSYIEKKMKNEAVKRVVNKYEGVIENPLYATYMKKIRPRAGNMIICRNKLLDVGGFRTDITLYEDLEFILRVEEKCSIVSSSICILEYVRSGNGLSTIKIPVEKEYAYYVYLNKCRDVKKMILADHIFRRIVKRFVVFDFKGSFTLLKHNSNIFIMIYYFIRRSVKSI